MTELTLVGLRVVFEVAQSGSFSAAADRLGYTQSAVSRQVAAAERAAGAMLFERQARGVRPTQAGDVLVRHAARVLDGVDNATQELAGLHHRLAGRLTVGCFPTAGAVLVPRALARLAAAHPGLQVNLLEASTPAQLQALRRGRLQVAVLATGEGLPDYDLDGLSRTELRSGLGLGVALAESHPFSGRQWVEPDELATQTWVVGAGAHGPEFGEWPGIDHPVVAFAVRDWLTRFGLAAAGLGIVLVPGIAAEAVPHGLRWIPVRAEDGGPRRKSWAVTEEEPSAAAAAMVTALEEEIARISRTVR